MPAPIDLTGDVYGFLKVIHESTPTTYPRKWVCQCECGITKTILGASLRSGLTKSCGCLNKQRLKETHTKHGETNTRLYSIWHNMKQRCINSNSSAYSFYGEKGITVCNEWLAFEDFKVWAEASNYFDELSIDRINPTKGYYPDNCRWANKVTQARNQQKRSTNTSGYTGVSYVPRLNKYQAYLTLNYRKVSLGFFTSKEAAFTARQSYINQENLLDFPT